MDCPHCNQPLPAEDCPSCGRPALTGADFCHHCGFELSGAAAEDAPEQLTCQSCGQKLLPGSGYCHMCGRQITGATAEDAPKLLTCESCGAQAEPEAKFCAQCGEALGPAHDHGVAPDSDERVACSDGMCVGIIGEDGKCVECGKPYAGPPRQDD